MITITREQLISLHDVSDCTDWIHPINQLLNSTSEDLIPIPEYLISELESESTWKQKKAVLDLNILDIQYPIEAYDFVYEILTKYYRKNDTWVDSENKILFVIDSEEFYFHYTKVYKLLHEKYLLNSLQISKLLSNLIYKVLNRTDLIPFCWRYSRNIK